MATQKEFEVGFSVRDECITIPIRDELENLVGVKARTIRDHIELGIQKFWFPYPTSKSRILYGLNKTMKYIIESGEVIVVEAEKGVQQLWSMGFKNSVGAGGHKLKEEQILKIEKLGVKIILAYDKGITPKEIKSEANKFVFKDSLYAIFDTDNLLMGEKMSPMDAGRDIWLRLYHEYMYKL